MTAEQSNHRGHGEHRGNTEKTKRIDPQIECGNWKCEWTPRRANEREQEKEKRAAPVARRATGTAFFFSPIRIPIFPHSICENLRNLRINPLRLFQTTGRDRAPKSQKMVRRGARMSRTSGRKRKNFFNRPLSAPRHRPVIFLIRMEARI